MTYKWVKAETMRSILFKFSSLLLAFNVNANTIINTTSGSGLTLDFTQDGIDNSVDLDLIGVTTIIEQTGNYNSINVDISGGTGTGSYLNIYQNGSDSYSANLICNYEWCGLTVNQ